MTLGAVRIPWIKRILRRCANRSVALLLRLRSRDYIFASACRDPGHRAAPGRRHPRLWGRHGAEASRRSSRAHRFRHGRSASHLGHPTMTPQAMAAVREREGRAAARIWESRPPRFIFLGACDGTWTICHRARTRLVADLRCLLGTVRPDEIFIPYRARWQFRARGCIPPVYRGAGRDRIAAPHL